MLAIYLHGGYDGYSIYVQYIYIYNIYIIIYIYTYYGYQNMNPKYLHPSRF